MLYPYKEKENLSTMQILVESQLDQLFVLAPNVDQKHYRDKLEQTHTGDQNITSLYDSIDTILDAWIYEQRDNTKLLAVAKLLRLRGNKKAFENETRIAQEKIRAHIRE